MNWARKALPVLIILTTSMALAAQPATVDVDGLPVLAGPGEQFKVLAKLPKGTPLAASNVPTQGYFKVRTPDGTVGWVSATSLNLNQSAPEPPEPATESPGDSDAEPAPQPAAPPKPELPPPPFGEHSSEKTLKLRAFGDFAEYALSDVISLTGFNAFNLGYNFGAEMTVMLSSSFGIVFRAEELYGSSVGRDTAQLNTFQFNFSGLPVMAGFELELLRRRNWAIQVAGLGGLALSTDLKVTALNKAAPNVTDLDSPATFMGLLKANVEYRFTRVFSVFAEGGYRILRTSLITPDTAINSGSYLFQQSGTGPFVPVDIDLSGPVAGIGMALSF